MAGHRLRVLVAGGAHPRFVRSFGHEVLHDACHPSRIELSVADGQTDRSR